MSMNINDFDYQLPKELIAQRPLAERDGCRLMVLDREKKTIAERVFRDIIDYLRPGDCLVMNDSRVIPARIFGVKEGTGARIEFLLIKRLDGDLWETMVRPGRRLRPGDVVSFSEDGSFKATVEGYGQDGTRHVRFQYDGIFLERLEELGHMPLPPYIERPSDRQDRDMYQTVYAHEDGSVAAPTAGASGILPGVICAAQEEFGFDDDTAVKALLTASAIGTVIAIRASISGAEGGCQAECGSGAAMAAAALVFVLGGDFECSAHAATIALKNCLGLVCDPVAGLVEVPCVKRNGMFASIAVTAADMAMGGIRSFIPPDEVIDAMYQIGISIPPSLRETSRGGLAVSPTGAEAAKRLYGKKC